MGAIYAVPTELERIRQAYVQMAERCNFRPAADGNLTRAELEDEVLLEHESKVYAEAFMREEDTLKFYIGVSRPGTNQALVFTIEAARALCSGEDRLALKLLGMAREHLLD